MTFAPSSLERIEAEIEPHTHTEAANDDSNARASRRLKIYDSDVRTHGYTNGCPRCNLLRQGRTQLARHVRHNEACRQHTYDSMREAGDRKVRDAESDGRSRTRAKGQRESEAPHAESTAAHPNVDEAQTEILPETMDEGVRTPHADPVIDEVDQSMHEPDQDIYDDTHDFHRVVDGESGTNLNVDWEGGDVEDLGDAHMVSSLAGVLHTLGVSAADAITYGVSVVKDRHPSVSSFGQSYNQTFIEVYGQGIIVKASHGRRRNLNVNGLRAFDLRTAKLIGSAWDFSKSGDRRQTRNTIEEEKPTWLIGSPPFTFFSLWNQGLNHRKMDPARVEELRREAIKHLHSVIGLYRLQVDAGRHFLHEHPAGASSWKDPRMERLMEHPKISSVVSDQCEYGLLTPNDDGLPTPAKKPTRWMSSSPHMLKCLSQRCRGNHVHQHLIGGRAKAAQDYSPELMGEILRGMRDTADHEEQWGDANDVELDHAVMAAGLVYDVRFSSLVAAYKADDLKT